MDTTVLEELGLSKGEIKVYTTLLRLGSTKARHIIEKTEMASSAVHNSLNTLIQKTLVAYIKKGEIKHYQAISPKHLLTFIDEKKKRFSELLPFLEGIEKAGGEKQEAEVFVGLKGLRTMLYRLVEDAKKGDEYLFFSAYTKDPRKDKEIQEFFEQYDVKRTQGGIVAKGIAPKAMKPFFEHRSTLLKVRYTEFPIPRSTTVCRDKIAFFTFGERPIGFLLTSKQMADVFRVYFHEMWEKCK